MEPAEPPTTEHPPDATGAGAPAGTPTHPADGFPYATWSVRAALLATAPFLLLSLSALLSGDDGDTGTTGTTTLVVLQLIQGCVFLSIPAIIAVLSGFSDRAASVTAALGFRRVRVSTAAKWIAIGFVTQYVVVILLSLALGEPKQDEDLASKFGALWLQFALIAVLAPISEEVFFRGMLFGGLRTRMSFLPAGIVSGLIFGAMHAPTGPSAVLPLAVFGFILAFLYERTRSLWPAIILHAVNNGISLILLNHV